MIFCSHVIEHQRNQGAFLDKIHDILKNDGDLVISDQIIQLRDLSKGIFPLQFFLFFYNY